MQGVVHNGGKIIIINEFFGVAHFLEAFKDGFMHIVVSDDVINDKFTNFIVFYLPLFVISF